MLRDCVSRRVVKLNRYSELLCCAIAAIADHLATLLSLKVSHVSIKSALFGACSVNLRKTSEIACFAQGFRLNRYYYPAIFLAVKPYPIYPAGQALPVTVAPHPQALLRRPSIACPTGSSSRSRFFQAGTGVSFCLDYFLWTLPHLTFPLSRQTSQTMSMESTW